MRQAFTAPIDALAQRWDIFCRIVDNFGDIGVCWRLAKQLAQEYGLSVRLWLDEPAVARHIINGLDPAKDSQVVDGVVICRWLPTFPDVTPADVVVEAFACELPANYLAAMAGPQPLWINLEYLSAEDWVEDFHLRASPHATLPLTKYFFFPGFTRRTGGLLRERGLFEDRQRFLASQTSQTEFWHRLGVAPAIDSIKVSLFSYAHAPVASLLQAMANGPAEVCCLVPQSASLQAICRHLRRDVLAPGTCVSLGRLSLHVLPFLTQHDYDRLLWACDLNFVRGEDSWVRAVWAGKPLVWQPYWQAEDAHLGKLQAFLDRYAADEALRVLHLAWSGAGIDAALWQQALARLPALRSRAITYAQELADAPDLAAKLVIFCNNSLHNPV